VEVRRLVWFLAVDVWLEELSLPDQLGDFALALCLDGLCET
jgi:hypothetical protein